MKMLLFITGFFILFSCKSTEEATSGPGHTGKDTLAVHQAVNSDLTTIYVLKKASLALKTDANGSLYKHVQDGNNLVVEIVYNKPGPEGTADGNYKEVFAFEIPDKMLDMTLTDDELREVKLVFARFCYCKGANRYLPVSKGVLRVIRKDDRLNISLDFEVRKSGQVIKQIDETIPLK